jgi:hypothetical protein
MLQTWHWCHSSIDNKPALYFWGHGFKCWHGDFIFWQFFLWVFLSARHIAGWYHDWSLLHHKQVYTSHPVIWCSMGWVSVNIIKYTVNEYTYILYVLCCLLWLVKEYLMDSIDSKVHFAVNILFPCFPGSRHIFQ